MGGKSDSRSNSLSDQSTKKRQKHSRPNSSSHRQKQQKQGLSKQQSSETAETAGDNQNNGLPRYSTTTAPGNSNHYQYFNGTIEPTSEGSDTNKQPPHISCVSRRALELEIKKRKTMTSVVLKSLSILLGIFFIFVGTTKITPRVSRELYKDLRKEFARYAKVFPLAQTLEFKIPSKWYRRSVGALEILCGICLTFIPSRRVKQGANLTLVLMMLFATYNHWMVGDKFERIAPSLVFFFMLTCRLIVEYQIKRKDKQDENSKVDKSTKHQQPLQPNQQQPLSQQQQQQSQQHNSSSNKNSTSGKEGRPSGRAKKDD